jgi:membrane fusion protein (multidrug efflux system)
MLRKYIIAAALLIAVIGALATVRILQVRAMIAAGAGFSMPPVTISSATPQRADWETSLSAIGTVSAVQGVLLRSEVSGLVKAISFESGAVVQVGQVLVELDSSWEEAQLRSAEAKAALARANLGRVRDLHAQSVLSQADLDAAEAASNQAAADVDAMRVGTAKKIIRAPFTGRLGMREIQLGQFADAGASIATLQSLDPVHVDFSLPEQAAARVRTGMTVRVVSDAAPGRVFEGPLTAISPEVDAMTRHLKLQATLSGQDGTLLPGMFARVELILGQRITPLVIPVTCVLSAPYGDSVFVIHDVKDEASGRTSRRVRMTTVTLGETRGDLVVVSSGLEEGQDVASSGVFKLRNDALVIINNDLAPSAEAAPQPKDS